MPHEDAASPALAGAKLVSKKNSKYFDSSNAEITSKAKIWKLEFSRSTSSTANAEAVTGDRLAGAATALVSEHHRIEVANNNRYCQVWDDSTDSEIAALRSS